MAILPFNLFTQIEIGVPGEWVEGKGERGVAGNLHGATERAVRWQKDRRSGSGKS